MPCASPHATKVHAGLCQSAAMPMASIVAVALAARVVLPMERNSGVYRYSVMKFDSEICQRCQNSAIDRARSGALKFCGILMPSIQAEPSAMSEYPLKSKQRWNRAARQKPQASTME